MPNIYLTDTGFTVHLTHQQYRNSNYLIHGDLLRVTYVGTGKMFTEGMHDLKFQIVNYKWN